MRNKIDENLDDDFNETEEEENEEEKESKKVSTKSYDEELDKLEPNQPEASWDELLSELDKRVGRLEKGIDILKQWLKKNTEDVERNANNFKLYIDKK